MDDSILKEWIRRIEEVTNLLCKRGSGRLLQALLIAQHRGPITNTHFKIFVGQEADGKWVQWVGEGHFAQTATIACGKGGMPKKVYEITEQGKEILVKARSLRLVP